MCLFTPYTPEAAAIQYNIIETATDIGEQICDAIKMQEEQASNADIIAQENNAIVGDGGNDDDNDEDDKDNK